VAAAIFSRLGFDAPNTDRGKGYPAYTVPKIMTQTKEGKREAVDARQHVRGALNSSLDGHWRGEVYAL